jgi:DNA-directed RNA polymerase subunit M/transcription elongation factor TFIIS
MEFIPIRSYDNYIKANLVISKLFQENINCYLKDDNITTIFPVISNAVGGVKICVSENDLTKAQDLLLQIEEEEKVACPKCANKNVHYEVENGNVSNWLLAVASWFLASYALKGKEVYHCYTCDYKFDKLSDIE